METKDGKKIDFAVGGQAVIEGVMMRSNDFITVAVRKESGGIELKDDPFKSITKKIKVLGWPLVRGVVGLFEMMIVGMKALNYSANVMIEEEEGIKREDKSKKAQFAEKLMFGFSFVFAIGLSLFLFKFLPLWITDWISGMYEPLRQSFYYNVIDGVLKTSFFIAYIAILTLMPSIRRVFEYHGAEHKSIYTYEKGLPLEVEHAKKQSRFHPRCGTSFILIVFMISILTYTMLPRDPDFLMHFARRLAFLPLIAGISYEFLKWSAKHTDNKFINWAIAPGLWFQKLTTKEPDDKQLEVALKALDKALELEEENKPSQAVVV
ncbi:DUF1385 domain-containing protein [Patescibacteria group bacterium]